MGWSYIESTRASHAQTRNFHFFVDTFMVKATEPHDIESFGVIEVVAFYSQMILTAGTVAALVAPLTLVRADYLTTSNRSI